MANKWVLLLGKSFADWQKDAPQTLAYLSAFCQADATYRMKRANAKKKKRRRSAR